MKEHYRRDLLHVVFDPGALKRLSNPVAFGNVDYD